MPPPAVTAHATGTPVMIVPLAVLMVTTGRQSESSATPAVVSAETQLPFASYTEYAGAEAPVGVDVLPAVVELPGTRLA
ncbi:MAG: hypothetical protein B7Z72_14820, partial [Gemmatimonadetes bacterium 21-71-4]